MYSQSLYGLTYRQTTWKDKTIGRCFNAQISLCIYPEKVFRSIVRKRRGKPTEVTKRDSHQHQLSDRLL
ncbi:hypothetical protein GS682_02260 [Nostoc sp. B(2019)]|nr:hypothetical protein [Nostoc sp. B(2019)]